MLVLASITALLLAVALVYCILAIIAARRYLRVYPAALVAAGEPVSILKPLAGLDPGLEANLRTFFEQDYTDFEILFAVREADDPAVAVVEKLRREYSRVPTRFIVTGEPPYANAKVYSLECMLAEAAHDLVVMSDSDIRVTPSLLRTAAAEFQDPKLGVATCPYRAVAGASLWSRLEAAGMNVDFLSGILVARMIEGMQFAVGPTIVARRKAIESIGGFERMKDYLAEDFVLGKFAAEAGHGVILSSYVVEHHIGSSDFRHNAAHRLRWARSTKRSRPMGYLGQAFTMPLPWAVAVCAMNPAWWPAMVLALAVRAASAYVVSTRVLGVQPNWALVPFEDFAAFGFWLAGFFGKTIVWRGRRYLLHSDGRFELLYEVAAEPLAIGLAQVSSSSESHSAVPLVTES
ncbi:MAG TPA: bacteriohopanetetrol glucosamine biosynthesis glycosyltransferase HpnI [Bryobacteraceae bacterium]|jgi:ceramide glucosyltransferase